MRLVLKAENDRRARGERDEKILSMGYKEQAEIGEKGNLKGTYTYVTVEEARIVKGDMWSGFRYTL